MLSFTYRFNKMIAIQAMVCLSLNKSISIKAIVCL